MPINTDYARHVGVGVAGSESLASTPVPMTAGEVPRPVAANRLTYETSTDRILNNGGRVPIVLTRDRIRIGCTDVDPRVAVLIARLWKERYGNPEAEFILQD